MSSQLQQVARLYLANRQTWWIVGWMTLMSLPWFAMLRNDTAPRFIAAQVVAFPIGGCVFLLTSQAKWQFCNPRASLLPGFAAPHLRVLFAIAVVVIGLAPLSLGLAGRNALGAAAFAIAFGALLLWSIHASQGLATILALALFFSIYNDQVAAFWLDSASATKWLPVHATFLLAGWAAIVAWLWRLGRLREEMDDYNLPAHTQAGSATRIERTIAARVAARQLLKSGISRRICDVWHDRLASATAATTHARQRLLRYGFSATPAFVWALCMAVFLPLAIWFTFHSSLAGNMHTLSAALPSMNMLVVMPGILASGAFVGRRPRMAQELLLPLTRAQYVDGLLWDLARSALITWLIVLSALLTFVAALSDGALPAPLAGGLAALTLGVHIYMFGATTRSAQIPQGGKRNVITMVLLVPAFITAGVGLAFLRGPSTTPEADEIRLRENIARYERASLSPEVIQQTVAHDRQQFAERRERDRIQPAVAYTAGGACALLGICLTAHSRRRWLNLELG
jgi:hypothetical protein